jgi:hypothetical protein
MTELRVVIAVAGLLLVGLSGCATNPRATNANLDNAEYVGVFTGEYVDGRPLYRLPSIQVVGSRSGGDSM